MPTKLFQKTTIELPVENLIVLGNAMLAEAEKARRAATPAFDAGPTPDGDPNGDWAAAGMLIGRAMHHLDESIPNGQTTRTVHATGALKLGTELLLAALERRGVQAAIARIGEPAPETPEVKTGMKPPEHSRVFGNSAAAGPRIVDDVLVADGSAAAD